MFPQSIAVQASAVAQWPAASIARLDATGESSWNTSREIWLASFVGRLGELRPDDDDDALRAVAADLWVDVGGHDPVIAAEMEHEAGLGFD